MNDMLRIGITGQAGFIGTHLFNYLGVQDGVQRIPFKDEFFQENRRLEEFVTQCDVIVHLAAVNRHHDIQSLHDTNVYLVDQLIQALEATNSTPHVLFSSSTQENRDNLYGHSKKAGRLLLSDWAQKNNAPFTGLVIPNVFGPFGRPFYNSVVSTFSHQLVHNLEPTIDIDAELSLIYINDLLDELWQVIRDRQVADELLINAQSTATVTEILDKLVGYKNGYMENGILPDMRTYFDLCLFNTFRSYVPVDFFPKPYILHQDDRGQFVELVKSNTGGQTSYSTTRPGITRGNHFHTRKVERFMVVQGEAIIQLRRIGTDEVIEYRLSGEKPAYVDIPIWYTHNITNVGADDMLTVFWINELFNPDDPDTFFEKV